jgi:glycosyltransferase involved in cell wall biosynthesis
MNILFPFVGDSVGGSYISTIEIIKELKRKNINTKVLLTCKNGPLKNLLSFNKIKFKYLKIESIKSDRNIVHKLFLILKNFFKVKNFLNKNNIEIIHCNDLRNNIMWSLWAWFSNRKMIWHQRTPWTNSIQVKFFILFASAIICNSKFVKNNFRHFLKKKIFLVYNIFKKKKLKKKINKKIIILGSFANYQKIKRHDLLIKLAIYFKKNKKNYRIISYGNDHDNHLTNEIKKFNIRSNFILKKFTNAALNKMNQCDIVLAMSDADAFGRTILESMAVSVPVIASNTGGHRELIKNGYNGILFKKGNYKDCAKKIEVIIKSKILRKKFIKNGLKFLNNFQEKIIINNLIKIYEGLIHEKKNFIHSS